MVKPKKKEEVLKEEIVGDQSEKLGQVISGNAVVEQRKLNKI